MRKNTVLNQRDEACVKLCLTPFQFILLTVREFRSLNYRLPEVLVTSIPVPRTYHDSRTEAVVENDGRGQRQEETAACH